MTKIQDIFDNTQGSDISFESGIYEGPLVIDRPCILECHNSIIWSNDSPVITVSSPNVIIKNLVIQNLGSKNDDLSILSNCDDIKLENVEVNARVMGIPNELESWDLPSFIHLGEFADKQENSFVIELNALAEAEIDNRISGLRLSHNKITKGINRLIINTEELYDETIIFGSIIFSTNVLRRINFFGKASKNASKCSNKAVYKKEETTNDIIETPITDIETSITDNENEVLQPDIQNIAPIVSDTIAQILKKGQRVPLQSFSGETLKVAVTIPGFQAGSQVDEYVFCLNSSGVVNCDEDLIFWGNKRSKDGAITLSEDMILLCQLDRIDNATEKIVIVCSVDETYYSQSQKGIASPTVRVFKGHEEMYRYEAETGISARTFHAMEIYRYKGEWKINCVGVFEGTDMSKVCNAYGVEVE